MAVSLVTNRTDEFRAPVYNLMHFHNFGAVTAKVIDGLIKAATTAELPNVGTKTYSFTNQNTSPVDGTLDDGIFLTPRNIVTTVTHASSVVAMNITWNGLDYYGKVMSELHVITATGTTKTVTGKKAFSKVTSVSIVSAGNATTNTMNAGSGDLIGLPYALTNMNGVFAMVDGVMQTAHTLVAADVAVATTITGDVRGTWLPSTAPNGTAVHGVHISFDEANAYGIKQA